MARIAITVGKATVPACAFTKRALLSRALSGQKSRFYWTNAQSVVFFDSPNFAALAAADRAGRRADALIVFDLPSRGKESAGSAVQPLHIGVRVRVGSTRCAYMAKWRQNIEGPALAARTISACDVPIYTAFERSPCHGRKWHLSSRN
jgi:hypothetical protein